MVGFTLWEAPEWICGKHIGERQEGVEGEGPVLSRPESGGLSSRHLSP